MQGIIIQARLTSKRLPKKIAEEIVPGFNVLEYVTATAVSSGLPVMVAMPNDAIHRSWSKTLRSAPVNYYFGSEANVLLRFVECAHAVGFKSVVRICSDNPFLNRAYLKELIGSWDDSMDYATWFTSSGLPAMKTHYGLFSEIAQVSKMEAVLNRTREAHYLEHVTPWFYENQDKIRIGRLQMPEPFWSGIPMRLTLDTANDLKIIRQLAANVDPQDVQAMIDYSTKYGLLSDMKGEILANTK